MELLAYEELWGIPIYRFPFLAVLQSRDPAETLSLSRQLSGLIREFRPDVVHLFQCSASAFFGGLTRAAHPSPHLLTLHGSALTDQLAPGMIRHHLMHKVDWIVTCSEALLREVQGQMPGITAYSSVVSNCLEMPALVPEPLPFAPPQLLCMGRVVPQKGFDLALVAFARLAPRFPGIRLTIAGDGIDKPELEKFAHRLGIEDSVEFRGWVQPVQVPALMNQCTLVIMPSRFEPFGLVALQAAQMARPVVATRVGGLPEVVVDGETGWLVENGDVDALVTAMAFLLDHPNHATRMGQAARRRAQEVFRWAEYVDAYESLYRTLVDRERQRNSNKAA